jgi:hypothetical protein
MTKTSADNPKLEQQNIPTPDEEIPPLENGDRLTQPEFYQRYLAMPHVKKAELHSNGDRTYEKTLNMV